MRNELKNLNIEDIKQRYYYDAKTGDLISRKTNKPLRAIKYSRKRPYYVATWRKNKKVLKILVHTIIWQLFYGAIPQDHIIIHIDKDPLNNKIDNLKCVPKKRTTNNNGYEYSYKVSEKTNHEGIYYDSLGGKKVFYIIKEGKKHYYATLDEALYVYDPANNPKPLKFLAETPLDIRQQLNIKGPKHYTHVKPLPQWQTATLDIPEIA